MKKELYSERLRAFNKVYPLPQQKPVQSERLPTVNDIVKNYAKNVPKPRKPIQSVEPKIRMRQLSEPFDGDPERLLEFETLDARSKLLSHNVRLIKHGYDPF